MLDREPSGPVASLANYIGTSEPALRLLLTVLLGYPVAIFYKYFLSGTSAKHQHVFAIVTGFILGYFNFGFDMLHTTATILVDYVILQLYGGTIHSVIAVFVFNMFYLLTGYICCETDDYDVVWTMPHCVLVMRLIGLAFDVYDGAQPVEKLSKLSQRIALKEPPGLLEMLAYSYFPTSFLVGPQLPLKRYREFVSGLYDEAIHGDYNNVRDALTRTALGFMYLLIHVLGTKYYSDAYLLSPEYSNQNFIMRCIVLALWARFTLYKYLACWLICEGSCILTGITYNGKDDKGREKWNGCANIDVVLFEGALNFSRDLVSAFNVNTNHWVFQYIYKRLIFLGNKYYSQIGVLLFLSVWHGFHSGYYMSFFIEFGCVAMEKDFEMILQRNKTFLKYLERPMVSKLKWVFLKLYMIIFLGPCVAPLALLTYPRWWPVLKEVYFFTHIVWILWPLYRPIVKMLLPPHKERKE